MTSMPAATSTATSSASTPAATSVAASSAATPGALPLARTFARRAIIAALAASALLPGAGFAAKIDPPSVPAKIQVPAGNVAYLEGHAVGTQNYTCQQSATGYAWTLVAPDAKLMDDKGKVIVTHYAGPTWQARDGSKVVGAKVDGVTVTPDTIPWLLLKAASTSPGPDGDRLTRTTFIHRVNTIGGLAPATGCDAAHLGAAKNVPYTADYIFYRAGTGHDDGHDDGHGHGPGTGHDDGNGHGDGNGHDR